MSTVSLCDGGHLTPNREVKQQPKSCTVEDLRIGQTGPELDAPFKEDGI